MTWWSPAVAIVGPFVALFLHEATHLVVARCFGPVRVEQDSLIPFRLKITYKSERSNRAWRVIALAPFLTGILIGGTVLVTGTWSLINSVGAFYVPVFLLLNWAVYSHISPADARVALNPD